MLPGLSLGRPPHKEPLKKHLLQEHLITLTLFQAPIVWWLCPQQASAPAVAPAAWLTPSSSPLPHEPSQLRQLPLFIRS